MDNDGTPNEKHQPKSRWRPYQNVQTWTRTQVLKEHNYCNTRQIFIQLANRSVLRPVTRQDLRPVMRPDLRPALGPALRPVLGSNPRPVLRSIQPKAQRPPIALRPIAPKPVAPRPIAPGPIALIPIAAKPVVQSPIWSVEAMNAHQRPRGSFKKLVVPNLKKDRRDSSKENNETSEGDLASSRAPLSLHPRINVLQHLVIRPSCSKNQVISLDQGNVAQQIEEEDKALEEIINFPHHEDIYGTLSPVSKSLVDNILQNSDTDSGSDSLIAEFPEAIIHQDPDDVVRAHEEFVDDLKVKLRNKAVRKTITFSKNEDVYRFFGPVFRRLPDKNSDMDTKSDYSAITETPAHVINQHPDGVRANEVFVDDSKVKLPNKAVEKTITSPKNEDEYRSLGTLPPDKIFENSDTASGSDSLVIIETPEYVISQHPDGVTPNEEFVNDSKVKLPDKVVEKTITFPKNEDIYLSLGPVPRRLPDKIFESSDSDSRSDSSVITETPERVVNQHPDGVRAKEEFVDDSKVKLPDKVVEKTITSKNEDKYSPLSPESRKLSDNIFENNSDMDSGSNSVITETPVRVIDKDPNFVRPYEESVDDSEVKLSDKAVKKTITISKNEDINSCLSPVSRTLPDNIFKNSDTGSGYDSVIDVNRKTMKGESSSCESDSPRDVNRETLEDDKFSLESLANACLVNSERVIYRDPDVVRADEDFVDESKVTQESQPSSKIVDTFRHVKENLSKEPDIQGPKTLQSFKPPAEPPKPVIQSEEEASSEYEKDTEQVDNSRKFSQDLIEEQKIARAEASGLVIYQHHNAVKADEKSMDQSKLTQESQAFSKMVNTFRQVEENLSKEAEIEGPKRLQYFTPPAELLKAETHSEAEESSEYGEKEEEKEEVDDSGKSPQNLSEAQKITTAETSGGVIYRDPDDVRADEEYVDNSKVTQESHPSSKVEDKFRHVKDNNLSKESEIHGLKPLQSLKPPAEVPKSKNSEVEASSEYKEETEEVDNSEKLSQAQKIATTETAEREIYEDPDVRADEEFLSSTETSERVIYRDPDVVRADEKFMDDLKITQESHRSLKMVEKLKQVEENLPTESETQAPKPLHSLTPPAELPKPETQSEVEASSEYEEDEEVDNREKLSQDLFEALEIFIIETPERVIHEDSDVRADKAFVDDAKVTNVSHPSSEMVNKFRQMKENLSKEPKIQVPKPLQSFTSPAEPPKPQTQSKLKPYSECEEEKKDTEEVDNSGTLLQKAARVSSVLEEEPYEKFFLENIAAVNLEFMNCPFNPYEIIVQVEELEERQPKRKCMDVQGPKLKKCKVGDSPAERRRSIRILAMNLSKSTAGNIEAVREPPAVAQLTPVRRRSLRPKAHELSKATPVRESPAPVQLTPARRRSLRPNTIDLSKATPVRKPPAAAQLTPAERPRSVRFKAIELPKATPGRKPAAAPQLNPVERRRSARLEKIELSKATAGNIKAVWEPPAAAQLTPVRRKSLHLEAIELSKTTSGNTEAVREPPAAAQSTPVRRRKSLVQSNPERRRSGRIQAIELSKATPENIEAATCLNIETKPKESRKRRVSHQPPPLAASMKEPVEKRRRTFAAIRTRCSWQERNGTCLENENVHKKCRKSQALFRPLPLGPSLEERRRTPSHTPYMLRSTCQSCDGSTTDDMVILCIILNLNPQLFLFLGLNIVSIMVFGFSSKVGSSKSFLMSVSTKFCLLLGTGN
ncbi:unnamed protein product [Ceutorhynchus assimilis]|uniref:Uncharacterized protein n=1 Tax=Ceutorhynchus assimilis TaxID=467358 RepID=A0A9P0DIV9_9CUCU|nr:unnamed protein product [Ceutorhynchus assimilis]